MATMVAMISCQKDTLIPTDTPESPKEIIKAVVMEGNFHFAPVENNQWVDCISEEEGIKMAKNYTISGTLAEMVNIQPVESMMRIISCQRSFFDRGDEGMEKIIRTNGKGILTEASGDQMNFTLWTDFSDIEDLLTAQFEIKGGTGKFEGCTGWITLKGNYNQEDGSSDFSGKGYMNYHILLQ
jgi:hypothetical protein